MHRSTDRTAVSRVLRGAVVVAVALTVGSVGLTSCSVVNAARKVAHDVTGNKATIDNFTNTIKSSQATTFEATYVTTGGAPATVVYAVEPPNGLTFRDTPSGGATTTVDIIVNSSGEYSCSGSGSAPTCQKLGTARGRRPEPDLRFLHALTLDGVSQGLLSGGRSGRRQGDLVDDDRQRVQHAVCRLHGARGSWHEHDLQHGPGHPRVRERGGGLDQLRDQELHRIPPRVTVRVAAGSHDHHHADDDVLTLLPTASETRARAPRSQSKRGSRSRVRLSSKNPSVAVTSPRLSWGSVLDVEVYVDPSCPWAWITSMWVKEVAPQRDLDVMWRSYCLEIRDDYGVAPTVPQHLHQAALAGHAVSHRMLRIFEAARARAGEDAVDALFMQWGRRFFGQPPQRGRRAPGGSVWRHRASRPISSMTQTTTGGTPPFSMPWRWPTRSVGPRPRPRRSWCRGHPPFGFKGPVMAPAPTGTAALRLWDAIQVIAAEPGFFEITRPRSNRPVPPPPV